MPLGNGVAALMGRSGPGRTPGTHSVWNLHAWRCLEGFGGSTSLLPLRVPIYACPTYSKYMAAAGSPGRPYCALTRPALYLRCAYRRVGVAAFPMAVWPSLWHYSHKDEARSSAFLRSFCRSERCRFAWGGLHFKCDGSTQPSLWGGAGRAPMFFLFAGAEYGGSTSFLRPFP